MIFKRLPKLTPHLNLAAPVSEIVDPPAVVGKRETATLVVGSFWDNDARMVDCLLQESCVSNT